MTVTYRKFLLLIAYLLFQLLSGSAVIAQGLSLDWAKKNGGTTAGVFTDSSGNVYLYGTFEWVADFDPGAAIHQLTPNGRDAFFMKLDSSGNFQWVKQYSGPGDMSIIIIPDNAGNFMMSGTFDGTMNLDTSSTTFQFVSNGRRDGYMAKLDSTGNVIWAHSMGSTLDDAYSGMAVDSASNIYITGSFSLTVDLDPGPAVLNFTGNISDPLVQKFDSSGNLLWVKTFGSNSNDVSYAVSVDSLGDILVIGTCGATIDLDPSSGVYNMSNVRPGRDAFLLKLSSNGSFMWAKQIIGTLGLTVGLKVDDMENIYLIGRFTDSVDVDPGPAAHWLVSGGGISHTDAFITKLDASGNFIWTMHLTNPSNCEVNGLEITDSHFYVSGTFDLALDLDLGSRTTSFSAQGFNKDMFIAKYDLNRNLVWGGHMTGSNDGRGPNLAVDDFNNVYCAGQFSGTFDFDPNSNVFNLISSLGTSVFLQKLIPCVGATTASITDTVCHSYTSPSGKVWLTGGIYSDTIVNSMGCDSIITINLVIEPIVFDTLDVNTCDPWYLSPSRKRFWNSSGVYLDTVPGTIGCDTIFTVNLNINRNSSRLDTSACESYSSPSGKYIWSQNGIYFDTLINSKGCDSILIIDLIIHDTYNNPLVFRDCESVTSPTGKYIWRSTGTYRDTMKSIYGCDSIFTVTVIIDRPNTAIDRTGNILTARLRGADYQWLDCNNSNLPIPNETNRTFEPSMNGSYAVIVTKNNCTDTSSCVDFSFVGINNNSYSNDILIYPNPVLDKLHIMHQGISINDISIIDVTGKVLISGWNANMVDVGPLPKGIYFIKLLAGGTIITKKFVKN